MNEFRIEAFGFVVIIGRKEVLRRHEEIDEKVKWIESKVLAISLNQKHDSVVMFNSIENTEGQLKDLQDRVTTVAALHGAYVGHNSCDWAPTMFLRMLYGEIEQYWKKTDGKAGEWRKIEKLGELKVEKL